MVHLNMKGLLGIAAAAALRLMGLAHARNLVATLDYGSFEGAYSAEYEISYWQKIPYAAPPLGENRFRAPQPPIPVTNGTYNSTQPFDMCVQRTVNGSEDCLYLSLYSRPWSKHQQQPLRPVVVVFHGGGFIQGYASWEDALPPPAYPVLNVSASDDGRGANDLVFVYPNYRLNAFGFLAGREVAANPGSDLNVGLLDQKMALEWTRRYVRHFGGDPEQVSIWGQSAGGGSVVAQVLAQGPAGRNRKRRGEVKGKRGEYDEEKPLFSRALASSPFWPKTYRNDDLEVQWRFDALVNLTGCSGGGDGTINGSSSTLACLKRVDVQTMREASLTVAYSHQYTTSSFGWGPVIDGEFLTRPLSEVVAGTQGPRDDDHDAGLNIQTAFSTYNTHEGESFLPDDLQQQAAAGAEREPSPLNDNSSIVSFDEWVRGYLPGFLDADIERLEEMYPETGSTETLVSYNDSYTRAGLVYRDSVLACPAYWMAGNGASGGWLGEYNMPPAQHADDVYWWNKVNSSQKADPLHYRGYAGALASFFMTGDPNALKLTSENVTGVPALETGMEFVMTSDGFAMAELAEFKQRCNFWLEMAPKVPI